MSDIEKGACRAAGEFDTLLETMKMKMEREGRSQEYIDTFWENLKAVTLVYAFRGEI